LAEGRRALRQVLGADAVGQPTLVVFPNATGNKRLPAAWWRSFIDELLRRIGPHHVIELVAADGVSRLDDAFPTYFSSDLRRLAAFIDVAGTYVSADCGVMHLAAATSASTVGLFRNTDPQRYAPYGEGKFGLACDDDPVITAMQVARHLEAHRRPCAVAAC
jgi:ADP-heptose:LPS heptosyltransferase